MFWNFLGIIWWKWWKMFRIFEYKLKKYFYGNGNNRNGL